MAKLAPCYIASNSHKLKTSLCLGQGWCGMGRAGWILNYNFNRTLREKVLQTFHSFLADSFIFLSSHMALRIYSMLFHILLFPTTQQVVARDVQPNTVGLKFFLHTRDVLLDRQRQGDLFMFYCNRPQRTRGVKGILLIHSVNKTFCMQKTCTLDLFN